MNKLAYEIERSCYTCHNLHMCPQHSVESVLIPNADYCANYMPLTLRDLEMLETRLKNVRKERKS